jgi:hypothetical protein
MEDKMMFTILGVFGDAWYLFINQETIHAGNSESIAEKMDLLNYGLCVWTFYDNWMSAKRNSTGMFIRLNDKARIMPNALF